MTNKPLADILLTEEDQESTLVELHEQCHFLNYNDQQSLKWLSQRDKKKTSLQHFKMA